MNKEKVKKLADTIRTLNYGFMPGSFNMCEYSHEFRGGFDCRSPACLAGWACAMEGYDLDQVLNLGDSIHRTAAEILGISQEAADKLFTPKQNEPYLLSGVEAASVLDHLVETGELDWSRGS